MSAGEDAEALRRRIEALEEEIARLKKESADTAAIQKRLAALEADLGRLKQERTGGVTAEALHSVNGFSPSASRVYLTKRGLAIGGYGSALYQRFTAHRDDDTDANVPDRADLTEAFLYAGYRFDDRLLFNSSFGIEHALVEDGTSGDATVEFAYIDFRQRKEIGWRGGLLLLPVGWLNERHEPNDYLGTMRPVIEQRILPSTWRGIGAGAYGEAGPVEWRGYVVESLDAAGFTPVEGIAGGRQQGSNALAEDMALTARADWRPLRGKGIGDLVLGASGFVGRTGQEQPGFPDGRLSLWDAHAEYRWRGFQARALYTSGILGQAGEISLAIDPAGLTAIGEKMDGLYAEIGYDVLSTWPKSKQDLVVFCRFENLNTQQEVASGLPTEPLADLTVKTCGVQYAPIRQVVIKADATNFNDPGQQSVDQVNLGLGWSF
ncbi:MAG TPA: ABC transporter C-terminal domain-containing protein [Candidatus Polarisedimenticolia bacterium]|nr:ABC transporter C-terminal domain-containing protein [Candidatus Polarisedimenticolia bacterium]